MRKFTLATIFFVLFTGFAQAEDYVRLEFGMGQQDGELQVAVESFEKDGITIDLYGVVHMADKSYFKSIQTDLATYDAVLYEGIKQGSNPNTETRGLNFVQKTMARVLGLTFQKDGIDYTGKNMVHADIDIDTLEKSLDGKKLSPLQELFSPEQLKSIEPFFDAFGGILDMIMESQPDFQNTLKMKLGTQLSETDIAEQLPPDMKKAIIDDRNQIVMDVLAEQLKTTKSKSFCFFYGAGHNPDFAERLRAQGYKATGKRWKTAWVIGEGVYQDPEELSAPQEPEKEPARVR